MPPAIADTEPRFLFVTVGVPRSGGSGGQIVSWRLLSSYAQLGVVDVLALTRPDAHASPELEGAAERFELVPVAQINYVHARARNAALFGGALLRREPFRVAKFRSRAAVRCLGRWLGETRYDAIHCDYLSTAPYRDLVPDTPAILAEHNVEWQQFSLLAEQQRNPLTRAALRADSRRTRAWEARALERFDHTLVLSEHDEELLRRARPDLASRISVWRVPVDEIPAPRRRTGPPTFVVLGSLRSVGRVHGLRWFLREVWEPVRGDIADARLEIIGADPPADIRGWDGREGVRVHGFVEDLEPFLDAAYGCAIPLFAGGGIRVKLLKLIGRGIPCVGTPVAMQGMTTLEGCVVAWEPQEWISVLCRLAERPDELWDEARLGARRLQVEHSPRLALDHLETVLAGIGAASADGNSATPRAARLPAPPSPARSPAAPGSPSRRGSSAPDHG
jgi:hypothetical protein